MRPISRFRRKMSSEIEVAARTSMDAQGKPAFGTPVTYRCHISKLARLEGGVTIGNQVMDIFEIFIDGSPAILTSARVTLSTGDCGSTEAADRTPVLMGVRRRFDERGPHHTVLHCGYAMRSA